MTTETVVTLLAAESEIREFEASDTFKVAVADWLAMEVRSLKHLGRTHSTDHALKVARAYLGEPS